ncbi:MAG: MBL fold metallo-hydrolase [Actinobacteria bacterium]|nr:MAG: MBL fold metallo-hydrolase [Actinomycetota bacterium]
MRVTVLGSAASHAGKGEACAGHYVEGGDSRVLLDCGNGVLANLYKVADPYELDAVFITHNHPDHYCDLYSMQAMLRYAPSGPVPAMPVFMPAELFERMQLLLSERGAEEFREAFSFAALEDGVPVEVGLMTVTPHLVDHTDPTFSPRVEADGGTLVYTADTAPGARASAAAAGADLLLAEGTLPEEYAGVAPHLTAIQAGELAREAGASHLVLVHVWPTNDRELMAKTAAAAFKGRADVAAELDSFDVVPRSEGTAQ